MKPAFLLPVMIALVACGDPRAACLKDASQDLTIVRALIADTEATLARGYAIQTTERQVIYTDFCIGSGGRSGGVTWCNKSQPVAEKTPVAVDLGAERGKLEDLRIKESELRGRTANDIQRCELAHP